MKITAALALFLPTVSATLSSTRRVCASLSSTSSDSIRVSFSGCSAAFVVVTKKATGPCLSRLW